MKFIIALKDLKALVKGVGLVKPKPGRFTLFACAARVFVEWRGEVAASGAEGIPEDVVVLAGEAAR